MGPGPALGAAASTTWQGPRGSPSVGVAAISEVALAAGRAVGLGSAVDLAMGAELEGALALVSLSAPLEASKRSPSTRVS